MSICRFHYIVGVAGVALIGCLGSPRGSNVHQTEMEREMEENLDGVEYRLQRLQTSNSSDEATEETLRELRRHRDELRKELDELVSRPDVPTDSVESSLRAKLEDLAIRYETARLGRFETRELFQKAVEARFEDLDRELALLEGDVFQIDLYGRFEETITRLYRLRNDVALLVAETAVASEHDFPRFKSELAAAIGRLDIMLAHATREIDRAYEANHPVRSIRRLWM